jgi:hypothetical protein
MLHQRTKKESDEATRANVSKEMAAPRNQVRKNSELNLDTARTPEQPSASLRGTVDKIIPPPSASQPEKAQISVEGADRRYRDLRIENTLTDEHGDDVKLKKGAPVEVTITAEPKKSCLLDRSRASASYLSHSSDTRTACALDRWRVYPHGWQSRRD